MRRSASEQSGETSLGPLGWPEVDFEALSPAEVVSAHRLASQWDEGIGTDVGTPWEHGRGLGEQMACYLGDLPANDLDRAKAVFEAFAESPLPDDRRRVGVSFVARLTQADHDAGLALWDRLIRDVDEDVRFTAYDLLTEIISDLSSAELRRRNITGSLSMRQKLELADKHELQELTGLSRPDAMRSSSRLN